ncbi:MAG TPA: T9SS type A sorting domain-containing protein [Chitinophagaceae bacterium]|jgi:hypothetical protein|nr:T9SS type A sorting domain-containing protein [Chitinophagaceae bacterium]
MKTVSQLRTVLSAVFILIFSSVFAQSPLSGGVVFTSSQCVPLGQAAPTIQNQTSPNGGADPYVYQWEAKIDYSSWTNVINVGNGLTLVPGVLPYSPTTYRRKVTDANGAVSYSNEITFYTSDYFNPGDIAFNAEVPIAINELPPYLRSNPAYNGTGNYTYNWEVSTSVTGPWTTIAGETSLIYQPPTSATAGTWYYRKKATDLGCGTIAYSKILALTFVDNLPLQAGIYNYRLPCVFPGGTPSRFQGLAARGGAGGYVYEWQSKLTTSNTWQPIASTNSTNFQPTPITANTQYRRKVTDALGAIAYGEEVTIFYADNTATPGSIAKSGSQIAPNAPLASAINVMSASNFVSGYYHWQQSTDGGSNWSDVTSNNGYSSYFPSTPPTSTVCYRRSIRENCENTTKDTWTNTICVDPALPLVDGTVSFAGGACITIGTSAGTITGTAATGGTTPYTYAWQTFDGANWVNIAAANGVSYTVGILSQTTKFRRVLTDGNLTELISDEITIGVQSNTSLKGGLIDGPIVTCTNTAPGIINNIIDACGGGGALTYTWEANTGSGWSAISGAIQPTHNASSIATTTKYRRKVGDACGNAVVSNEVEVFVYPAIEAGSITPATQSVCTNQTPTYLGLAQNCHYTNGNVTYQWQRSTSGSGSWTNINGATQPVYMPTASNTSSYYRLVVKSSVCNAEAITNVSEVIVAACSGKNQGIATDGLLSSNLSTKGSLKMYPNPVAKGQTIFVTLNGDASNAKAILRGIDGRAYACTVEGATKGAMQIKVPANIARGTYVVQINTSNKQWIERVVVY